ncbi:MAG: carbon-nitrogen hydrolase [Planctomycetota bacterium]
MSRFASKDGVQGKVRVGLAQAAHRAEVAANLDHAVATIELAGQQDVDVLCLQELVTTPYFCQIEDPALFALAEPIPGPSSEALAEAAGRAGVAVVTSLFEERAPGLYHNCALVISPEGEIVGRYRKMHIPHDPGFYEKYYFTPGDGSNGAENDGFLAVEAGGLRIGPLICWDQWFPEAARITALRGAELLVYPTAIGWLPDEKPTEGESQLDAWRTMHRAHAIANGVFVAASNRVGREGETEFWGHSLLIDPFGRILAEGGEDEDLLVADCDRKLIESTRREWPFLRDRRVDAYGGLLQRYLDS